MEERTEQGFWLASAELSLGGLGLCLLSPEPLWGRQALWTYRQSMFMSAGIVF